MNKDELLDGVRKLEISLYADEFRDWVKTQSDADKETIGTLRTKVISYRSGLETNQLKALADKLDELSPELNQGLAGLRETIKAMNDFAVFLKVLDDVVGLVSRIVGLAG
jgi:hypothetical protein